MEIIDHNKSLLENIYLISGPILAILGCLIFYQIKLAKKSIELADQQIMEAKKYLRTISKREAAALAAKQVEIFMEKIIPMGNQIYNKKEEIDFPKFNGEIKNFTNDELKEWDKDFTRSFSEKMLKLDLLDIQLINFLEGFATYFTKGIADEEIAFSSVGRAYCNYVESYYPQISITRGSNNPNKHYNNLIELYKIWNSRLDKFKIEDELKKKQQKIKEELKDFENIKQQASKKEITIKPLGTE